jgi:uncharacterized protein YecE (DUF72 family)
MKKNKGILRVGTSGIAVAGNKASFPLEFREKSRLNYYASLFNTIEINSSFYKIPMRTTFERWSLDVPPGFRFTLKLWRDISHAKALDFKPEDVAAFLAAAEAIGEKKGCILVQFPGKINLEYYAKVEELLSVLQEHDNGNHWPKAVEFRNPDWYVGETAELLRHYGAALVVHDKAKGKNKYLTGPTAFVYLRFHGPEGNYRGSYSDEFLGEQARLVQQLLKEGKDVYAYFNNTMGSAFENARTLVKMVEQ